MGSKPSVQKVVNKTENRKPSHLLADLVQTNPSIYMSETLVKRLARSTDAEERVTVYNVGPSPTIQSCVQDSPTKTLSVSKPPPTPYTPLEDGVNRTEPDRTPRVSTSLRSSSLQLRTTSSEQTPFLSHDPVRRQIEEDIEEDLRLKAMLTSSIREQIRNQEAAYWETNSRLSNARNILSACYAANRNNPIACARAAKLFADTVNSTLHLVDTSFANKR